MAVRKRLGPVALLLAVALATACGSTVQQTALVPGGTAAQGGALAPAGAQGLTPAQAASQGALAAGGTTGAAAAAAGRPGAAPGPALPGPGGGVTGPAAPSLAPGASGPGVTAKEIYVGFIHDVNAGAVNQAAGLGAITSGDSEANTKAVVDDINKHGGLAGRKLVPVFANFDSTSTQTLDQQYASVCAKFTTDSPRVFAVQGTGTESYRNCLTKAGVVILGADLPTVGASDFARHPTYVEQGYANVDRLAAYHLTPLVAQKYFTPWNTVTGQPAATGAVKVGVLTYNDTVFSPAVDRYLVPALRKLGYQPEVVKVAQVSTASDYSSQAAAVKSAQLSFAANGVTHVLTFESNGGLSVFFLANARSQGYYPRYGISSANGFQALKDTGAYDDRQFNGAVGYGWIPALDLSTSRNPANGPYSNDERRHCLAVMKEHGITFDSGNAEAIALATCAALYLLKAALPGPQPTVTATGFMRAVEGLGRSYQGAGTVGEGFRPGRHDASDRAYWWKWYADCTCLHYEGSPHEIP